MRLSVKEGEVETLLGRAPGHGLRAPARIERSLVQHSMRKASRALHRGTRLADCLLPGCHRGPLPPLTLGQL